MIDFVSEYKDLSADKTIQIARTILNRLNINMIEDSVIYNHSLYSMRLFCPELNWHTNGKGLTVELCRASAYGEAMERIQNLQFSRTMKEKLFEQGSNVGSFSYFPDEKEVSYDQIVNRHPEVKQDMINSYIESDKTIPSDFELKNVWTSFNETDMFKCIPFYSLRDDNIEFLPYNVLQRLTRSNGTAAGNTPEEALCQGLSEILERYSQEMIYRYNYSPPLIPLQFLKDNCSHLYDIIESITQNSHVSIYVMDASLGKGFPVLCLLCVDKTTHRYRVKFGSHPVFRIALERCLTELAQGNDFKPETLEQLMVEWNDENQTNYDTLYNWGINHRKNQGAVPNSFFLLQKSWQFRPWEEFLRYDNKTGLNFLLEKCKQISTNIYIRDNSFLGFYSYWIYIPGISTTYKFHPLGKNTMLSKRLERIVRNPRQCITTLSVDEKKQLISIFNRDSAYYNFEFWEFTKHVILAALYVDVGRFDDAIKQLKNELNPTKYVLGTIRELELRQEGVDEQNRNELIKIFFDDDVLYYIVKNWRNDDVLTHVFYPFNLKKHRDFLEQTKTQRELFVQIESLLKAEMQLNTVDQYNIRNIVKNITD